MPASSRRRGVRSEAPTFADRPVQLQSQRRFFSNQGNDRATREARALTNVFSSGAELSQTLAEKNIKEGRDEAIATRGAGQDREEQEGGLFKNAKAQGYNTAWDQLDAESDLNLAKTELPAYLESIDAESLNEKEFTAVISEYMKGQFDGIDPVSAYGRVMAPGLLAMEQSLLTDHREHILESIQQDQRSTISNNAEARITEAEGDWNAPSPIDGKNVYEYLADQTNTFFDGANKKKAYWETVYDFAIRAGRPELIENVPAKFADGSSTGIDDPNMADEHRAAIASATVVKGNAAKARQDAVDKVRSQQIFDVQIAIYEGRKAGQDVQPYLEILRGIPGVTFTEVTSAESQGDSQLTTIESRSPDLSFTAPLWNQIHTGTAGIPAIFEARKNGFLGYGPQADKLMDDMMGTARTVQGSMENQTDPATTDWRNSLNKRYNPQLGGLLSKIDKVMQRINIDANNMYTALIAEGQSATDAHNSVIEKFDVMVDTLPDLDPSELEGRRSQGNFTADQILVKDLQEVVTGTADMSQYAGIPRSVMLNRLGEILNNEEMSEEDLRKIVNQLP